MLRNGPPARKSPKHSHGGLVTAAPITMTKALRLLEAAYAKKMIALEAAQEENKRLRAQLKEQEK